MKFKIGFIMLMATAMAVLTSCSGSETGGDPMPEPMPTPTPEADYPLLPGTITRTGSQPVSADEMGDIRLFVTLDDDASYYNGMFQYQGNSVWKSTASINSGWYHIYGFMPAEVTSTVTLGKTTGSSNYQTGAVLTFSNLSPVQPKDFCIITAAQETNDVDVLKSHIWNYDFKGAKEGNYLSLLLDHLYTKLVFNVRVGEDYSKLRTIRMKQLALQTDGLANMTLNVTLPNNQAMSLDYITFAPTNDYPTAVMSETATELKTDEDLMVTGFFAPLDKVYKNLYLVATYDVYDDTNTTRIRQGCTAKNKLTFDDPDKVVRGNYFTFNLTVEPTYLYQLSDADLDNPTVKIQ